MRTSIEMLSKHVTSPLNIKLPFVFFGTCENFAFISLFYCRSVELGLVIGGGVIPFSLYETMLAISFESFRRKLPSSQFARSTFSCPQGAEDLCELCEPNNKLAGLSRQVECRDLTLSA